MKTVLALLVALLVWVSTPATAEAVTRPVDEGGDYRPCITMDEYLAVHIQMPRKRAERIIDSRGIHDLPSQQLHALIDYVGGIHLNPDNIYRAFHVCDDVDLAVVEFKRDSPRQRVILVAFGLAPNS